MELGFCTLGMSRCEMEGLRTISQCCTSLFCADPNLKQSLLVISALFIDLIYVMKYYLERSLSKNLLALLILHT